MKTSVFAWLAEERAAAQARGTPLVDLGIGSPDLPTPSPIVDAITRSYDEGEASGYPSYFGRLDFREAAADYMAERFGVTVHAEDETVAIPGIESGFTNLLVGLRPELRRLLVPDVCYPLHLRAPALLGIDTAGYALTLDAAEPIDLDALPARQAGAIVLNFPHNPTGAVVTGEALERIVAFCLANDLLLVSDLAYAEVTYDGHRAPSVLEIPGAREIAIELHSFSKTFNMAGSRLGFAVGGKRLIGLLKRVCSTVSYGVPVPAQRGGIAALREWRALTDAQRRVYQVRRDALVQRLAEQGWRVTAPSGAMFVWLQLPAGTDDIAFTRAAIEAGVVVTPGSAFGAAGAGRVRISLVGDAATLAAAADTLTRVAAIPATV